MSKETFRHLLTGDTVKRTLIMGILNITQDSFSDGGLYRTKSQVLQRVGNMISAGADIIDIGGESSSPGSSAISVEQELERVIPVIEWIKSAYDVAISVDTYKTEVMAEVLNLGIDLINDINALQSEGALNLIYEKKAMVCLMHKSGNPVDMQDNPNYVDVVAEIIDFLKKRIEASLDAGISAEKIIIDPGFGFGKTLSHNIEMFRKLDKFIELTYPVLIGVSRKNMLGEITGATSIEERSIGSVVAAAMASIKGVRIVRVHDVLQTKQALDVVTALN